MSDLHAYSKPNSLPDDEYNSAESSQTSSTASLPPPMGQYRLYKRRFVGLVALVLLNLAAALNWMWFPPIANTVSSQYGLTLDEVNWLANSVNLIYLPISLVVPPLCTRFGLQYLCAFGALCLLIGGWIRYAAAASAVSTSTLFGILMLSQVLTGISQPIFQILAPTYSERWFSLDGRTTATMFIAISNPVGAALAQLLSPMIGPTDATFSILILAVITSALTVPASFLVFTEPPTPPTLSASQTRPTMLDTLRDTIGMPKNGQHIMTRRQRIDFVIVTMVFGSLVGGFDAAGILLNQYLIPYGYTADVAGDIGAAFILTGIVAAIATAPLFDRYLSKYMSLVVKVLVTVASIAYVTLIWGVRENNTIGLYVQFIVIGICSFILLPVALELGCEVTRDAETSSAIFWFAANLLTVVYIVVEGALRAGADASPPLNMHRAIIFQGIIVIVSCSCILGLEGKQTRREQDKAAVIGDNSDELTL